jgi:hypothetical protein
MALVGLIAALVFNARRLARLIHGAAEEGWEPVKRLTERAPGFSEKPPQVGFPTSTPAEVRVSRRVS